MEKGLTMFEPNEQLDIQNLSGLIKTVVLAPTYIPRKFSEQFVIYNSQFYYYDTTNAAWKAGLITPVGVVDGGTGLTALTQGDLLYASATNTLAKLAKDTNSTRYLSNQGTSNNPSWNQVNLANGVTGALPIANGGTGQTGATAAFDALAPTTTQGDIMYHNGTDNVRLAKGTASQVLTMNAGATAPEWAAAGGGGMSLLADVNLSGAASSLSSGTITACTYLVVHIYVPSSSSSTNISLRFNSDSGSNYSYSVSREGAAPATSSAATGCRLDTNANTTARYGIYQLTNIAAIGKLVTGETFESPTSTVVAGEMLGFWNNTSNQITSIQLVPGAGNLNSGTRMLVYGVS